MMEREMLTPATRTTKTGGAIGRPTWVSSLLGDPGAKFLWKSGVMGEKQKKRRILCATGRGPNVASAFATHRAGRGGRGSRQGAAQVVFGIAMVAREPWAAQAQDFHNLSRGCVLSEQLAGQPEIDDAPIGLGEALANIPTLKPALIHRHRALRCNAVVWSRSRPELLCWGNGRSGRMNRRPWLGVQCKPFLSDIEQLLCGRGQDWLSIEDLNRRRQTRKRACRWLEIAEAGQTAQVAPIGAGLVAAIALGQEPAQSGGHCRLQRLGAGLEPRLEVAGTGLERDTWFMPVYAHVLEHVRARVVQVKEDIARVAPFGVGPEIDVEAQAVVCAQRTHHPVPHQLLGGPQTFCRSRFTF